MWCAPLLACVCDCVFVRIHSKKSNVVGQRKPCVCVCVVCYCFFCFHNHTTVNNITHMHRNKRWIKTKPLRHVEINVRKPITKKHSFGNRTSAVGHSKKPTNKAIGRLATREAVYRRYRTDKLTPQRLGINRKTSLGHGFDP